MVRHSEELRPCAAFIFTLIVLSWLHFPFSHLSNITRPPRRQTFTVDCVWNEWTRYALSKNLSYFLTSLTQLFQNGSLAVTNKQVWKSELKHFNISLESLVIRSNASIQTMMYPPAGYVQGSSVSSVALCSKVDFFGISWINFNRLTGLPAIPHSTLMGRSMWWMTEYNSGPLYGVVSGMAQKLNSELCCKCLLFDSINTGAGLKLWMNSYNSVW